MIKAECVAASKCQTKIATFKVTMPRYILAEFNTHRVFTRNSASSRAIPFSKMVRSVEENPFTPIAWQRDHKGMQGSEYLDDLPASQISDLLHSGYTAKEILNGIWAGVGPERPHGSALYNAIECANELNTFQATKQICNRLLEPFMYHTVLVTATEWDNFFELRCPKYQLSAPYELTGTYKSKKELIAICRKEGFSSSATMLESYNNLEWLKLNKGQADIHMMAVAEAIYNAWNEADFKELAPGEWHIPFGDQIDLSHSSLDIFKHEDKPLTMVELNELKIKIAVARCARLSYQTLGDNPKIDYISDVKLYNNLKQSGHWSPFEHVAQAMSPDQWRVCIKTIINKDGRFSAEEGWLANFRGWIQQRCLLENAA